MLPELQTTVRNALANKDFTTLFQAAHKLAGSAGCSGAPIIHAKAMYLKAILKRDPLPMKEIEEGVSALLKQIDGFNKHFTV
jgi:HPt (histidine-containing phosphotransfer) domain-containing protein